MSKYFIFIPNLLSIIRIYLMYPLLTFISEENYIFALYVFIVAAATDGLDGYLARVMNWQTDLGKILDPVADKVLLIGTILILWLNNYIPLFVLIVLVLRDFIIIMGAGEGKSGCMLHNSKYDFNDDILPLGIAYWEKLVKSEMPLR